MTDESCVQVALYDNRLEVTSPGGLYNGLTFEEAMQGHSKLRNRAIANVFGQIGLVESWGTGLQRIRNSAREYGLPEPEFIEMSESFRVNFFRYELLKDSQKKHDDVGENVGGVGENVGDVGENVGDVGENVGEKMANNLNSKNIVIQIISDNVTISASEIAKKMSVTQRTVERYIKELKAEGKLIRHGSARGGHWEAMK
jgi:predicted HTH transcriptional regulator